MTGRRFGSVMGVVLLLASFSLVASAADGREPEGWAPALRIGFGVNSQGLDGNLISPDSLDPIRIPPTDPLVPDTSSPGAGGDSATTEVFRLALRLYAPEDLIEGPSYVPRLFLQSGFEIPLDNGFFASRYRSDFDDNPTNPNELRPVDACAEYSPPPPGQSSSTCSYDGEVAVDILYNWSVGLGADFRLPIAEGQFHVVPVVEYFGQAYEANGQFNITIASGTSGDEDLRPISAQSDTEILHGIATTLGFEVDVYEGEQVSGRLFLEGRAAWLLSDRETTFSGTNLVPTTNFNTADFLARPSTFIATAAAGFEFRWTGGP